MVLTLRRTLASLALAAAALLLAGCVVSEEDAYTVTLNPDGRSGSMTVTRFNLQSDEREPAKQREDFQKLMETWKGDAYLLERAKEGVYVKTRDLGERQGRLVWKETSIFADITGMFQTDASGDTLRIKLDGGESVVSTNGRVVRMTDSTLVLWPRPATSLELRIRHGDFHPTSDFVADFRRRPKK